MAPRYRRLPWLISVMTLVALTTVAAGLSVVEVRLVEMAGKSLALAAKAIAGNLDLLVAERFGAMRMLGSAEVFRGRDTTAMTRHLLAARAAYPIYLWLGVTDAEGRIIAATAPESLGKDYSQSEWFRTVITSDRVYLRDPEAAPELNGARAVPFAVAVKGPKGEFLGAILAYAALATIEDWFKRTVLPLAAQPQLAGQIEYQLLARDGTVLIDSVLGEGGKANLRELGVPSARLLESGPGYIEERHLRRRVPVITGYARTKGAGGSSEPAWGVLVRKDRSDVLASIRADLWPVVATGAVLFVPMLGLLFWTTRRLQKEWVQVQAEHAHTLAAEKTLRTRTEKLQVLVEAARRLTAESDVDRILEHILKAAQEITEARYAALGVFDPAGERLVRLITEGVDEATRQAIGDLPTGHGLLGHLAKQDGPLNLPDLTQHPAFTGFPPHHPPMRSFLGISIRAHGRMYGLLYLTDKQGGGGQILAFTTLDEQMLTALSSQAGVAIGNSVLLRDIQQAEADLRLLLESTDQGIYGLDTSGRCTFINRTGAALLGYAPDELIGRELHSLIHHADAQGRPYPVEACPIYDAFRLRRSCRLDNEVFWRRDGTSFPVEYSSRPIEQQGVITGAVVTFTDITERRKLEGQLRHAQKMDSIGQLAGGIAHDFNNLLTVINGYSEILLDRLGVDAPMRAGLQEIQKAGQRAAMLTGQILAFSRRQMLQPQVLDLNELVRNLEQMLKRLIGEDITLTSILDPAIGPVKADPGQLDQVLVNLAVNARDAMPSGGRLTIETAPVELDEAYARMHPGATPGPYVMLAVSDTGCGMDAETQARVFEPFFTTKEKGKGTGLGLSTVYGIVKQSGGYITVYSEVGCGTTFKIYLPRITGEAPRAAKPAAAPPPTGSETILLVEDEEAVRAFTRSVLESQGYTVLEARDGAEALRLAQDHPGEIHLLVTDVVMPGLSGRALAERLAPARPTMNVLYLSGYTDNAIVHHGVLDDDIAFLQKPFTRDALARKVRAILDRPPQNR